MTRPRGFEPLTFGSVLPIATAKGAKALVVACERLSAPLGSHVSDGSVCRFMTGGVWRLATLRGMPTIDWTTAVILPTVQGRFGLTAALSESPSTSWDAIFNQRAHNQANEVRGGSWNMPTRDPQNDKIVVDGVADGSEGALRSYLDNLVAGVSEEEAQHRQRAEAAVTQLQNDREAHAQQAADMTERIRTGKQ